MHTCLQLVLVCDTQFYFVSLSMLYYPKCILLYRLPYQKSIQHDSFLTFSTHNEVFLQASSHRYTRYGWFEISASGASALMHFCLPDLVIVASYFQFGDLNLHSRTQKGHEVLGSKNVGHVSGLSIYGPCNVFLVTFGPGLWQIHILAVHLCFFFLLQ